MATRRIGSWRSRGSGWLICCLLMASAGCRHFTGSQGLVTSNSAPTTRGLVQNPIVVTACESQLGCTDHAPAAAKTTIPETSISCPSYEFDACCPNSCESCKSQSLCFGCDVDHCLPTLWSDAKGVVNWNNSLILLAAGGAAIAMREGDADREVREAVAENPLRMGATTQALGKLGNVELQAPVLLGLYGLSLWAEDAEMHHLAGSLISATSITGLSTTALKLVTNTDRPSDTWNGGHFGFPSYHTASSFAIAAVLDEYYGAKAGWPAYALAAAIGFSRLDEQDHDLSDVVFGGTLGFVVGKAVAGRHRCGQSKIQFLPYFHPTDGAPGVCCEAKF